MTLPRFMKIEMYVVGDSRARKRAFHECIFFLFYMFLGNNPIFSLPQAFLRKASIPLVSLFTIAAQLFYTL